MKLRGFSICNETWGPDAGSVDAWPRVCADAQAAGYTGIELAPFTFAADCRDITAEMRRWIASVATDHGLYITALHWLLVSPPGLHIHTSDTFLREKTTSYLKALADLAVDVGAPVMVLGSPKARTLEGGDLSGAMQRSQDEQRSLEFKATEAEKERQAKITNFEQERMLKQWLEQSKQDANDRATSMATAIENQALDLQKSMAQFQADQQIARDAEANRAQLQRDQMAADKCSGWRRWLRC
jgi:sugar phosphate isomerase/epimerase